MNIELAFILHQRPYRETSVLLDVFSERYGRLSLIAKGVRHKKRSQMGTLQIFQPLFLSWFGRGELLTVSAIEPASARYILKAQSSLCGLYVNELLVKLLPKYQPEPEIFAAYKRVLSDLQNVDNTEIALRLFEKKLLMHLGYGLVIDHEVTTGHRIEQQHSYYYQPDSGLYHWSHQTGYPLISGRSLLHLSTETDFDQQSLKEIKQLMRSVIHFYLGGRVLHSRQLFSSMHNTEG